MNKISKVFLTICISVLGVLASSCDQHVASEYGCYDCDIIENDAAEDAAIIEISGKVVNVKKEALENIKVVYVNRQELAVFTDKDGFFVLRFSQSLETQMNLEKNIIVSDPDEIYAKKEVAIELLCDNSKDPGYEYECKNDQTEKETEIILEKQLPQV